MLRTLVLLALVVTLAPRGAAQEPVCRTAGTCAAALIQGVEGALEELRALGDESDAEAQVWLALYYQGKLQTPNPPNEDLHAEGLEWLRKAARQGYPMGLYYLAQEDAAGQLELYRLAAEQGHAGAQAQLAVLYLNGKVVGRDLVQAYSWMQLGIEGQDNEATRKEQEAWAQDVAQEMTPEQIAEAKRLADEWVPKTWDELKP